MSKQIISAGTGRGYWHGSRADKKIHIFEPLIEDLHRVIENKGNSAELRYFAREMMLRLAPIGGASIADTFENDLMKLIFGAVAIANIADNAATSPLTVLSCGLHTADPGEAGNETTNEATYTSYARVSNARDTSTSTRWVVTNNSAAPNANIDFPAGTGGSGTVTHFHVGTNTSNGTGKILFSGTVTPNIVTGNGVTPRLTTASTITID